MTRQKFLDGVAQIGIAQKVVRLRLLDHFMQRAIEDNYTIKAAAFMEQAAKECGGLYEARKPATEAGAGRRPPRRDASNPPEPAR